MVHLNQFFAAHFEPPLTLETCSHYAAYSHGDVITVYKVTRDPKLSRRSRRRWRSRGGRFQLTFVGQSIGRASNLT